MGRMIFYELKKILTLKKTIAVAIAIIVVCIASFSAITGWGNWEIDRDYMVDYYGEVTAPIFDEAREKFDEIHDKYFPNGNYDVDEETQMQFEREASIYESVLHYASADGIRKEKLAEYGFTAETLVLGLNMAYIYIEAFTVEYAPLILCFIISLFVAPVFSSEYSNGVDGLLLSSKKGKKQLIAAKFIAAMIVTVLSYVFVMGVFDIIAVAKWGFGDSNTSFIITVNDVFDFIYSPYNFNVLEYSLVSVGVSLAGCIGYGIFNLFVSSKSKNSLISSMICLAVAYIPYEAYLSVANDGVAANILRFSYNSIIGVHNLFIGYMWDNYSIPIGNFHLQINVICLLLLAIITPLFALFAFRAFRKHQVAN